MIRTETVKNVMTFHDDAKDDGAPELEHIAPLAIAAMKAGLREFTVPTPNDDHNRWNFRVRTWVVTGQDKKPKAFLVAYKEDAVQIEILGPEVPFTVDEPKK